MVSGRFSECLRRLSEGCLLICDSESSLDLDPELLAARGWFRKQANFLLGNPPSENRDLFLAGSALTWIQHYTTPSNPRTFIHVCTKAALTRFCGHFNRHEKRAAGCGREEVAWFRALRFRA